jgi:hypothetical protein
MKSTYPVLADFFTTALHYYLIPDLIRLRREVRPKGAKEGCTIATASLVFSLLDLVGFLMRPDPKAKKTESTKNISFALAPSAGLFTPTYAAASPVLVGLFRHGITHQVFPKACGISKPNTPLPLIFSTDGSTPSLNVDVLVDDLLSALVCLEQKANATPSLAARMEGRLVMLQKEDNQELLKLRQNGVIGKVCQGLHPTATTTTTTTPR